MIEQDLNDLYYFVKVVEYGGFSAAERALGIPKSRLSRRLSILEDRLGVRLLHRSTRNFALTDIGETYLEHCIAMLAEADEAQAAIDRVKDEPNGVIRLTCPIALLHVNISQMLTDFMALYPQVTIYLEATNRVVDVVGEGIDVAIRVRPEPLADSDLILRVLGERGQAIVGSPQLIKAQGGLPNMPAELSDWPSLAVSSAQKGHSWNLYDEDQELLTIAYRPRFITTDMLALREAAIKGIGIVQLPDLMVNQQLARGELVDLLPRYRSRREIIHAVFSSRQGLLPAVRALIDFLALQFPQLTDDICQ